jgi:hypothetical protein
MVYQEDNGPQSLESKIIEIKAISWASWNQLGYHKNQSLEDSKKFYMGLSWTLN